MSVQTSGQHRWRRLVAQAMPPDTWPLPARWPIIGATSVGVIGATIGLVVGLLAYPSTAWFAVFEAGIPAAIAGGVFGLLAALLTPGRGIKSLLVTAGRWIKRGNTTPIP